MTATVTQIATALGMSRVTVNNRAKKWQSATTTGVAKYDIETIGLSKAEQSKIMRSLGVKPEPAAESLPVAAVPGAPPAIIAPLPDPKQFTGHQNRILNARVYFMKALEADMALGHRLGQAMDRLMEQINSGVQPSVGQALIANDRKRKNGDILKPRSLMRWWMAWRDSGRKPEALAPNDGDAKRVSREARLFEFTRDYVPGSKKAVSGLPAWLPWLLDAYRVPTHPGLSQAWNKICRVMPAEIPRPTYSQAHNLMKKVPVVYQEKGRKTGAEYRALCGFNRRDASQYDPFTLGQIDGHSFKAYVAHPTTGAHFHPEVCGIVCDTSKVLSGWSWGLAESKRTVSGAVRSAYTVNEQKPWGGIYAMLEPDLGPANKSFVISDDDFGLLARFGTKVLLPETGGNPQGHGAIERAHQSIWIKAAKELPTYTGKDMDRCTRKRIYTRLEKDLKATEKAGLLGVSEKTSKLLLSKDEFSDFLDEWALRYNNTPHRALPKITDPANGSRRHMSPFEYLKQRYDEGWRPVIPDQEMLDHLFMPHVKITVKRCEFNINGNRYHSYELHQYHEQEMLAAYDADDASYAWVLDLDERLICKAAWEGNKIHARPVSETEQYTMERNHRQVKLLQRKLNLRTAETRDAITVEHGQELQRIGLHLVKQIEEADVVQASAFTLPKEERDRHYYWQAIDERLQAGEKVQPEEASFHCGWQTSDYFRVWQMCQEDMSNYQNIQEG